MTAKTSTKPAMSEESMIGFLRNALVVAGQEMGDDGDHWPVIKSTVHSIMKTWEDVKIERNVDAEMKKHLYTQIEIMEASLPECTPEARVALQTAVTELREVCDAYFEGRDESQIIVDEDRASPHVKRARAILTTLEGETNEA